MFLVGRDGETCIRYANSRTPSSIREDIEAALGIEKAAPTLIRPPSEPDKVASAPAVPSVGATAADSPMSVTASPSSRRCAAM